MKNKKVQYKIENNEFETDRIKNRTCYYFDDIIEQEHFDFYNILIDEKSHENVFIYNISCKNFIGSKYLRTRFDEIDGIIRIYDGNRYLKLFGTKKYDAVCDTIRYVISISSGITYIFSHYFVKIKHDSYDSSVIKKNIDFV